MLLWRRSVRCVDIRSTQRLITAASFGHGRDTIVSGVYNKQLASRNIPKLLPTAQFISYKSFSTSSSGEPSTTAGDEDLPIQKKLVYNGPMSRAVRLMKGVSVTSCILTSIGMPTLCLLSEQSASMVGKWAMCGTIMLFGLGTTSLFHYLFKPYVMRMWIKESDSSADPEVTVETVTLFAQLTTHSFHLSEVAPPAKSMHPMISFQAKNKNFFVHPECFEDQELVTKLLGRNIEQTPAASKDE